MTRAALFIAGAILCLIPAASGVINGVPVPGHFSLSYPGGAMSGGRFMETWRLLNGIETGARIEKRRAS